MFTYHERVSARKSPQSENVVIIILSELPCGRFRACHVDSRTIIAASRQAFCDAARALLASGEKPSTILIARNAGSPIEALRASIGKAAKLRVEDCHRGSPRFRPYKPMPVRSVGRPMRHSADAVPLTAGQL